MERKLASIQKITNVEPIEGKDRIVLATIQGWKVIVGKDQFNVGDNCVYFEIDSILPDVEMFSNIKTRSKLRIKTMKLGGVYSFGFCISIDDAKKLSKELKTKWPRKLKEGLDVTEILKVEKYEEDEWNRRAKGYTKPHGPIYKWFMRFAWFRKLVQPKKLSRAWPEFLIKTDEERVENLVNAFERWRDEKIPFHITSKMDGQSATFCLKEKEFIVCSRNCRLNRRTQSDSLFFETAEKYRIEDLLRYIKTDLVEDLHIGNKVEYVCLQGEQCGPTINGNRIGLKDIKLYIFNLIIKTEEGIFKLNPMTFETEFYNFSKLECVPYLGETVLPENIDELRKMSYGYYNGDGKHLREGIVLRNYDKNISFKCVNPDYLLKHGI